MNKGVVPQGWNYYGSRRRYPYPKGHYFPHECPCKLHHCPANYYVMDGECFPCRAGLVSWASRPISDLIPACTGSCPCTDPIRYPVHCPEYDTQPVACQPTHFPSGELNHFNSKVFEEAGPRGRLSGDCANCM